MLGRYRPLARNVDFRRLFLGRLVTNAGDSVYFVAAMWLVFEFTGSTFYTGLAGSLTLAPRTLQFLYGPLVDRWDARRVLVRSQLAQSAFVLVLPLAAAFDLLSVGVVLVVMPTLMAINQFIHPAINATIPRLVEDEHLVAANSAFSVASQGVDMLATAVGGVLISLVGATTLFVADSVTFAVAATLFAAVSVPAVGANAPDHGDPASEADTGEEVGPSGGQGSPGETDGEGGSDETGTYLAELRDGLSYVRGTVLAWMLGVPVVVNLGTGMLLGVLPAYASLFAGPSTYGVFMATSSSGLLVGSVASSWLDRVSLTRLHGAGFLASGALWLAGVWIHQQYATAALFLLAWIPVGVTNVLFWTVLQTHVPADLVGRASSVAMSVSVAWIPVGSFVGGVAAAVVGTVPVVAGVGVIFALTAGYWLANPVLRGVPAVDEIDPDEYGFGSR